MNSGSARRSGRFSASYQIVVRGEVTDRFAEPLEGVVVESAAGQSILRAENVDQARLQAILGWLYDHGIGLVSVNSAEEADPEGAGPGA